MFWKGTHPRIRTIRVIVEIIGLVVLIWMLVTSYANAQQTHQATTDWQARHDVGTLQYRMETLLGPDGSGSQSGTVKMMNDHMHNTDLLVQEEHDFMEKLLGFGWALTGLQIINLLTAIFAGKKGTS